MEKTEVSSSASFSGVWSAAFFLLLFTAVCTASCSKSDDVKPQPIESEKIKTGRVVYPKLASAPCPHPKREKGYTFRGTRFPAEPHYSDSTVAVFIPEDFKPKNAADSFGGKLESPGGFSRLAGEVIELLKKHRIIKKPRLGSVVLAGHSGGYRVISHILSKGDLTGRIEGVLLFDALFDNAEMYAEWIVSERGRNH